MNLELEVGHEKNQLVVHTAIEKFPKIELTEGKSEEGGRMWNGIGYDRYGNITKKYVNGKFIRQ